MIERLLKILWPWQRRSVTGTRVERRIDPLIGSLPITLSAKAQHPPEAISPESGPESWPPAQSPNCEPPPSSAA
jgi:hypothetical protein